MWGFSCVCYCSEPGFEYYLRTAERKLSYTCKHFGRISCYKKKYLAIHCDEIKFTCIQINLYIKSKSSCSLCYNSSEIYILICLTCERVLWVLHQCSFPLAYIVGNVILTVTECHFRCLSSSHWGKHPELHLFLSLTTSMRSMKHCYHWTSQFCWVPILEC